MNKTKFNSKSNSDIINMLFEELKNSTIQYLKQELNIDIEKDRTYQKRKNYLIFNGEIRYHTDYDHYWNPSKKTISDGLYIDKKTDELDLSKLSYNTNCPETPIFSNLTDRYTLKPGTKLYDINSNNEIETFILLTNTHIRKTWLVIGETTKEIKFLSTIEANKRRLLYKLSDYIDIKETNSNIKKLLPFMMMSGAFGDTKNNMNPMLLMMILMNNNEFKY